MEFKLTLAMPRDQLSVRLVRHLLTGALTELGVHAEVVCDVGVALTEACTNVLDHVTDGAEYEVSIGIRGSDCVIEVIDTGGGFDATGEGLADASIQSEGGRGIQLMRALVDRVSFRQQPSDGTIVLLEKRLTWEAGSAIGRLTDDYPAMQHGPWSGADLLSQAP